MRLKYRPDHFYSCGIRVPSTAVLLAIARPQKIHSFWIAEQVALTDFFPLRTTCVHQSFEDKTIHHVSRDEAYFNTMVHLDEAS